MAVEVGTKVRSAAEFLKFMDGMKGGVRRNVAATTSVTIAGSPMSQKAILAELSAIDALFANVEAARHALAAAIKAKDDGLRHAKQFGSELKKGLEVHFGTTSPLLLDFGLSPPTKAAPRTAAQKAASAGLGLQTRHVRGTRGRQQNAAITLGGRPGVVIVGPTGEPLVGVDQGAPIPPAELHVAASGAAPETP